MDTDTDINKAWEIFDLITKENESLESLQNLSLNEQSCKNLNCNATFQYINSNESEGIIVCTKCGMEQGRLLDMSPERTYCDDTGFKTNMQRTGMAPDKISPYGNNLSTFIAQPNYGGKAMKSFWSLNKWQSQQAYDHKQKSFSDISNIFHEVGEKMGLPKNIIDTARTFWRIVLKSQRLTRASVRKGLIANCLAYACIYNRVPENVKKLLKLLI